MVSRPRAISAKPDDIPEELKGLRRWVAWRYEQCDQKWAKVPINCHRLGNANVRDASTWTHFEEALTCYRSHELDGVGFVFQVGDGYCGIDLDDCRDAVSGELAAWAQEVVRAIGSYAEVSPSGKGVKLFLRAELPGGRSRRKDGIEVYGEGRYFTVTGARLANGSPLIEHRQEELARFVQQTFGQEQPSRDLPPVENHLTDAEIIAVAMRAANGDKFARLWAGNDSGYPSESEADLALCNLLAFYAGPKAERIELLFNQSGFGRREKWVERADYRHMTIAKALAGRTSFYQEGGTGTGVLTRIIQDYSGTNTTVVSQGKSTSLTADQEQDSRQIAIALADAERDEPDWQVMFALARKMKRLAGKGCGTVFREAVSAFCERAGKAFDDYFMTFLDCFEKVRLADGEDVFEWAKQMAEKQPYVPDPCLTENYAVVASVAFHLSEFRRPNPFWLPGERIAGLLNTNAMNVSRIIRRLAKNGILRCVNDTYSYKQGIAKEYLFIGPPRTPSGGSAPALSA